MTYLFLRFKPQQPVGVTHYGNRRERHCRSGNHRVKQCSSKRPQNTGGDRNTDTVVDKRAEQVLLATPDDDLRAQNEPLRRRLVELQIISTRPFVPGARIEYR